MPPIGDIIDDDDTDFFAMDLLDHLLRRDDLSEPERIAEQLLMLRVEVGAGGLEQYYVNSSGDQAASLPAALKAVGVASLARIIEQVNTLFGSNGPSENQPERRAQIAGFGTDSARMAAAQPGVRSSAG